MVSGLDPVFASRGPVWPLAQLPLQDVEPEDPALAIPSGALQSGAREAPEPHFQPYHDAAVTHTASEPLAPAKTAHGRHKGAVSLIASCFFHVALAAAFLYVADEAVMIEGADFSGIAALGNADADQVKAGEISDTEDAVEVTMVTMLEARPVETVRAEAVPVDDTTETLEVTEAVDTPPETLQPVTEQPIEPVTSSNQAQDAPSEPSQSLASQPAPVEPAESVPVPTVTETVPEVLATDQADKVEDDNVVQQPAETQAAEPAEAAEAVQAETSPTETSEATRVEPVETEVVAEATEAEAVETPAEAPLPQARPQRTARQAQPREVPKEATERQPRRTAERSNTERKQSGRGGQNQAEARRGQADGSDNGDNRQASRGGSRNGQVGNAAVSNYPGKVRSKLVRASRSVRARGRGDVVVSFAIASNGSVRSARVSRSSGDASVDQAALQAVRKAAPFPPIPDGAGRSSWNFDIPLAFRR